MRRFNCLLLICTMWFGDWAAAQPITLPPSLPPGQAYRLAFVTSLTMDATSTNIGDYNAFVTGLANSVPECGALLTPWFAVASTSTVHARDNTQTDPLDPQSLPIYTLDGTLIANSYADFWDGILAAPIRITENGLVLNSSDSVWTGSNISGFATSQPLGNFQVTTGSFTSTGASWIQAGSEFNFNQRHLYAISGALAGVPEPSALVLLGLGVIAMPFRRRPGR